MANVWFRLSSFFLIICGFAAWAQSPESSRTAGSLIVSVFDAHGNPTRDLTKDSFRIKVNGHVMSVQESSYDLAPRRIVVLLDMSGSMALKTKWQVASEAVHDLLRDTPPDVHVALFTFTDHVRDIFGFSQSRDSMTKWLNEHSVTTIKPGKTAIYDSTMAAVKFLQPTQDGDAVYLITDGGDNSSTTTESIIRNILLQSRIRLYLFLLSEPGYFEITGLGTDALMRLTKATGGFVFGVRSNQPGLWANPSEFAYDYDDRTKDRIKSYTRLLNVQVNGFYRLQYHVPLPQKKLNKISLEIVDSSGNTRKDLAWSYPELLPTSRN
jgi:Mg-chelatase subunit ChlD